MIPTETGPAGGHSLYCLADGFGCNLTDSLFGDFASAIKAAVDMSNALEDWEDPAYVVAVPHGPEMPPRDLRHEGQLAAIVLRKVVFVPATGQALEPTTHPSPWGELRAEIDALKAQSKILHGLKDATAKALQWFIDDDLLGCVDTTGLDDLIQKIKTLDCPF